MQSITMNPYLIFALRFQSGLGQSMSCVGKSFVFDLVSGKYVQFFFSLKSISSILITGELPGLGSTLMDIYKDYSIICRMISAVFLGLTVLFFLFFIVFPKKVLTAKEHNYQAKTSP